MPLEQEPRYSSPVLDREDQLIDDILRDYPGHQPGTRPVHAPGIGVTGWFRANRIASRFTLAEHFAGNRVPVSVRFSEGTGLPAPPPAPPVVRGMAIKFHLEGHRDTDLVCMTLPVFFVKTVADFQSFTAAGAPAAVRRRSLWRRLLDELTLATVLPDPPPGTVASGDAGLFAFADRHPEACPAMVAVAKQIDPYSYTTLSYHAVHAFRLTAADGSSRWARLDWEPVGGVHPGEPGADLSQTLRQEMAAGRAGFILRAQLAEPGDDPADPTRPWPRRRPRLVLGRLWLEHFPSDQTQRCELLSFNPARLVPGLEACFDDEIFWARQTTYERSYGRRLGELGAGI